MTDFNPNNPNPNPNQNQPEYGQYAPGAGPQGQQRAPQYGQYAGANPGQGPYGYGQPQAGQNGDPYANPFAGQNQYGQWTQNPGQNPGQQSPFGQSARQPLDPFKLIESMLPQRTKNWVRATYAIIGVAAIVLGLALLIWPGITLQVAAVLLGVYFIVSGVTRVVTAIVELGLPAGWRILDILVGVLLAVGGVVVLKNSALSGQTLAVLVTMTVGLGWMLEGFMALVESWRLPSSGWAVLYAVISIVAGFVVLLSPITSTVWLVIFGGCALVVMGVSAIVRGFKFGRLPKNR
ncbi:hypothetical protein COO72_04955 [Bifidobacterium callitrichos]|nr:hypothetical protein COO72_04955 [Bifidobacterium callitrichos]